MLTIEIEDEGLRIFSSVCLYSIIVKAELIGPKLFMAIYMTPGKGLWNIKVKIFLPRLFF